MKNGLLFEQPHLGPYLLRNRIVMPPLTRSRGGRPVAACEAAKAWSIIIPFFLVKK